MGEQGPVANIASMLEDCVLANDATPACAPAAFVVLTYARVIKLKKSVSFSVHASAAVTPQDRVRVDGSSCDEGGGRSYRGNG
eukprot:6185704-Pleurochrysis_carterae.AAC.2